jgi:N-acetylmuramoyl-L-alanine amidase
MPKIYLSASTQENNIGVANYGSEESNMFILRDRIEHYVKIGGSGDRFIIYKNSNKAWSLSQIVADSNSKKVDSHWANHSNAGNDKARGCEVYYYYKTTKGGDKMASLWYKEISAVTPTSDRGYHKDSVLYSKGLYETSHTTAAAALCEHFFHSNSSDVKFFKANIDLFAIGTAIAIYKYYGYTFTLTPILKSYTKILKEVSNYSDVWIEFVNKNPQINLKGLIQMLYYTEPK